MQRLADSLYSLAITLWVGGLWAVGFIVAPSLFASLKDRVLAGELAGNLFGLIAWVGMACAAYLLGYLAVRRPGDLFKSWAFRLVVGMLVLTLAVHFGIQPILAQLKADALPLSVMESAVKSRFVAWHGAATGLYVLQSLLGAALVLLQGRGR
ncbi:MAG: DUF4149 domain-containing protein [Betaproteobacteria bacterium]|nr:DUF4149 domain-containing protein [Betaproteobacteria bacterium]